MLNISLEELSNSQIVLSNLRACAVEPADALLRCNLLEHREHPCQGRKKPSKQPTQNQIIASNVLEHQQHPSSSQRLYIEKPWNDQLNIEHIILPEHRKHQSSPKTVTNYGIHKDTSSKDIIMFVETENIPPSPGTIVENRKQLVQKKKSSHKIEGEGGGEGRKQTDQQSETETREKERQITGTVRLSFANIRAT